MSYRCAALLIATMLAYLPALRGGFIWDDDAIVQNEHLKSWTGLKAIWTDPLAHPLEEHWWPLLHTTFWLEFQIWGLDPFGYHLVNVLLHALNSALIYVILRRLEVPGAWLAAAVFAVHPLHVESVAWIIERKDVLSGAFYLLAVLAFLRHVERPSPPAHVLSLALFACAMLTKSVAITLPVVLALLLWRKQGALGRHDAVRIVPFVSLAIVLEYLSLYIMGRPRELGDPHLDALPAFALERWPIAGQALCFYAVKLFSPTGLMPIYPRWPVGAASPVAWLALLVAVAAPLALWLLRKRIGRAPLVGLLFFMVTLGPTLGLVNFGHMRYAFVADRFAYLASLGLIALGTGLVTAHWPQPRGAWPGRALAVVVLAALGTLTWRQSRIYADNETFWRFGVARNPQAWAAEYNLAVAISKDEARLQDAIARFERVLEARPNEAQIHNSLAIALAKSGDHAAARRHFEEAIRLDPNFADPHYNLGYVLVQEERFAEAIPPLRRAVLLKPTLVRARSQLAFALSAIGDIDGAVTEFREAARRAPDQPELPFNLGLALLRANRVAEAIEPLTATARARPEWLDARCELGGALLRVGRTQEGLEQLREVLRADPNHARARRFLETGGAVPDSGNPANRP